MTVATEYQSWLDAAIRGWWASCPPSVCCSSVEIDECPPSHAAALGLFGAGQELRVHRSKVAHCATLLTYLKGGPLSSAPPSREPLPVSSVRLAARSGSASAVSEPCRSVSASELFRHDVSPKGTTASSQQARTDDSRQPADTHRAKSFLRGPLAVAVEIFTTPARELRNTGTAEA